jgi:hypothetical protein
VQQQIGKRFTGTRELGCGGGPGSIHAAVECRQVDKDDLMGAGIGVCTA